MFIEFMTFLSMRDTFSFNRQVFISFYLNVEPQGPVSLEYRYSNLKKVNHIYGPYVQVNMKRDTH